MLRFYWQDKAKGNRMQLTVEANRLIESPSDEEIANLLPATKFAVISDGPDSGTYMQFSKSRKYGIELEYQIDSLENHFKASDASLAIERVITAFQKYAKGDDSWKTGFQWK